MKLKVFSFLITLFFSLATSSSAFAKRDWGLGVGLVASPYFAGMETVGTQITLHLGPWITLNGSGLVSENNFDLDESNGTNIDKNYVVRTMGLAQARIHPFAGSFNIAFGIGSGNTVGRLKMNSRNFEERIDEKIEYRQLIETVSIGNIWSFWHVYFGFDWVGFASVVKCSKSVKSNNELGEDYQLASALDTFRHDMAIYGRSTQGSALVFNGGIVF